MPNAPEPDRGATPKRPGFDPRESRGEPGGERLPETGEDAAEDYPLVPRDAETETVVLRSKTGTVRRIKTTFRMIGTKAAPMG